MKTEQQIRKRIKQLTRWRTKDHSLDPGTIEGSLIALEWVLKEDDK